MFRFFHMYDGCGDVGHSILGVAAGWAAFSLGAAVVLARRCFGNDPQQHMSSHQVAIACVVYFSIQITLFSNVALWCEAGVAPNPTH